MCRAGAGLSPSRPLLSASSPLLREVWNVGLVFHCTPLLETNSISVLNSLVQETEELVQSSTSNKGTY